MMEAPRKRGLFSFAFKKKKRDAVPLDKDRNNNMMDAMASNQEKHNPKDKKKSELSEENGHHSTDAVPFEPVELPRDEEGFIQSFGVDQEKEFVQFFKSYGFVVVNNILSPEDIEETVTEVWKEIKRMSVDNVEREDPNTWTQNWPSIGVGILGNDVADGPVAWKNRQNPNLYKVFSSLLGTEFVVSSVDRYGMMRPTKNIPFKKGKKIKKKDMPTWLTQDKWFHWDLNPWKWTHVGWDEAKKEEEKALTTEQRAEAWKDPHRAATMLICENNDNSDFHGFDKVQGLVALEDSREDSGGFQTVPAFHLFLPQWSKQTPRYSTADFVPCPPDDALVKHATRISMRKGSVVVWSSRMPHCNYPNSSERFRACQYIKMFPMAVMPKEGGAEWTARAEAVRSRMPKETPVTELGAKMLGLAPWQG